MTSIDTGPAWIPPDLSALAPLDEEPDRSAAAKTANVQGTGTQKDFNFFGEDGFSFSDILDIVNPLQHIPIVATVYRALTGDEIAAGPRMVGGALFGGPVGAALATANAVLDESTGRDAGEHVLALFQDDLPDTPDTPPVAVAAVSQSYAAPDLAALAPLPGRPVPAPAKRETTAQAADAEPTRAMPVAAVEAALVASKGDALTLDAIANPPSVGDTPEERRESPKTRSEPAGNVLQPAAQEGWFSAAMLAGLDRYAETRNLITAQGQAPALSATY